MLERDRRLPSIDRFRGIAIVLMIAFTMTERFTVTDFFEKFCTHDLSKALLILPGYGFFDIIAPFFIFASGLSLSLSFSSLKRKNGLPFAYFQSYKKAIKVIGLGSFLMFSFDGIGLVFFACAIICLTLLFCRILSKKSRAFIDYDGVFDTVLTVLGIVLLVLAVVETVLVACSVTPTNDNHWTVLPAIGVSMLVGTFFVDRKPFVKTTACYLFTLLYFLMNLYIPQENYTYFVHGGLLGSFGYALLFLYADTFITLWRIRKSLAHAFAFTLAILAVTSNGVLIPSKAAVNVTYALVSFVFSYVLYVFVSFFDRVKVRSFPLFTLLGQNSLMIYVWHVPLSPVVGIMENALIAFIPVGETLHIFFGFVGMVVYVLATYVVVWTLKKNKVRFRI